jgi:hypothetical protein
MTTTCDCTRDQLAASTTSGSAIKATLDTLTTMVLETEVPPPDCIRVHYDVDRDPGRMGTYQDSWMLHFTGRYGASQFLFVVTCPEDHSVEDWMALADGKRDLECYQGNGGGGCRLKGNNIEFNANPSGGGGDVELTVSLPLALVARPLREAIQGAVAEGLPFRPELLRGGGRSAPTDSLTNSE